MSLKILESFEISEILELENGKYKYRAHASWSLDLRPGHSVTRLSFVAGVLE